MHRDKTALLKTPSPLHPEASVSMDPPGCSVLGLRPRQILVFGVILYFTFIGGSFYSDLNFPLHVFNQVVVTVLLGSWLVGKLWRGEPFPRTLLDAPIVAWLAAHFIAALLGLSPRFSLEKLWTPFVHALAFYLLVDLRRKGQIAIVARGLYMSACVVCLVGLTEFASWYFGLPLLPQFVQGWPAIGGLRHPFPPTFYRLNFTLTGATPLSAYLALLIPPALGILLTARKRDDRQAIAAWLVLAIIVEVLSSSRGGVLALLVSLPLTGFGWWLARRHSGRIPRIAMVLGMLRRPVVLGSLATVLILAGFIGPTWLERTFNRAGSTQFRFTLWEVALTSFREHPLTGVGPHNFGRSLLRRNDPTLPRRQIMTAHSIYLNTLTETGLFGLAAGSWLLVTVGRAWLIRWRSMSSVAERTQIAATGAALVGLAAQGLVDTFAPTPNVLPVLAIAVFALTSDVEGRQQLTLTEQHRSLLQRAKSSLQFTTGMALLALALYAAGLAWLDVGQFHFQRSVNRAMQGKLSEAVLAADLARQLDPAMPLYTFQLADLESRMTDKADMLVSAIGLYRAGLEAEPVIGSQTANLAAAFWRTGDREAAIATLEQAVMVEPDPLWQVNLGYFYEQTGNVLRAVETYGRALALSPGLAGSEFWQASLERGALWPDILARAEAALMAKQGDLTSWRLQIALAQGDWPAAREQARRILERVPRDCGALSTLARAWIDAEETDAAMSLIQQAIDAQPACGEAYVVRGMVRQMAGDPTAAERDWRTALFLNQREAAYYLGQVYQVQGDYETASRFYWMALPSASLPVDVEITLYGRRAAFDLLPPLFRIGVGPAQAGPWLALGQLFEAQGNLESARRVYEALLLQDPYLGIAQERMNALTSE